MVDKEKPLNVEREIELLEVSSVSPHNKALLEAGRSILLDSVATGREFCKFMISFSIGAIPVYFGLLKFILPENHTFTRKEGIIALIPAVIYLISSVIFVLGYFPNVSELSLDIPSEIERARVRIIKRSIKHIRVGFAAFLVSTMYSVIIVFVYLTGIMFR